MNCLKLIFSDCLKESYFIKYTIDCFLIDIDECEFYIKFREERFKLFKFKKEEKEKFEIFFLKFKKWLRDENIEDFIIKCNTNNGTSSLILDDILH